MFISFVPKSWGTLGNLKSRNFEHFQLLVESNSIKVEKDKGSGEDGNEDIKGELIGFNTTLTVKWEAHIVVKGCR